MAAKKVQVILLDNVKGLGNKGQLVEVSGPYAQNVLFPKKLGKLADASTINEVKQKAESIKRHHDEELQHIKDMLETIKSKGGLVIQRQATAMEHLYDKVDEKDIAREILMVYKVKLSDKSLKLAHKIESLGEYTVGFEFETIKDKFQVKVERK